MADHLPPNPFLPYQAGSDGSKKGTGNTGQPEPFADSTDQAGRDELADLMVKARAVFRDIPEINLEKVIAIKQRVYSGIYTIPMEALAGQLLKQLALFPQE